jgi:hypothetical protein
LAASFPFNCQVNARIGADANVFCRDWPEQLVMRTAHLSTSQNRGAAAVIAIVSAIASFFATFSGHPFWGLFIALLAVVSGLFGFAMAASPKVSGGILSIVSIILGVMGVAASVLGMVGVILF